MGTTTGGRTHAAIASDSVGVRRGKALRSAKPAENARGWVQKERCGYTCAWGECDRLVVSTDRDSCSLAFAQLRGSDLGCECRWWFKA